ncbi:hypothetical protein RhiirC2_856684 [Rhizophagus irregularis]|uniref:Uncharacterized protein n=1 Tax=Rhizophagus irregularis TaxID=588596 RepID=A0A2N1MGK9_9GLOM|nr:hypothetical protein RhiirC2_856684 [Rhizophagus irregularis]
MKKYILCIFVVLLIIITNSSYAFPASSKPMSKRAKMEPIIKTYDIPSEERTSNVMGISHGILYEPYPDFSTASWAWHQDDFANLLQYAENSQ